MATIARALRFPALYTPSKIERQRRTHRCGGPTPSVSSEALDRIFTAAVLLTGGVNRAESAISDAIGRLDPGRASNRTLFLESFKSALAAAPEQTGADDVELPSELKRVLRLPLGLRRCFVLRILAGLSREQCAALGVRNIDRDTCAALQELARIASSERSAN